MDDLQVPRLVEAALRCYPRRWQRRHGAEAAELATLLIRDGTPAFSVACSYLAGAAREWLAPRPGRRLSTVACALLAAACSLGISAALLASTVPAKAVSHPPLDRCSGPQDDLVKRVIALPGQRIYSAGNTIYIGGRPLAEPYLPKYDPLGPPIRDATSQHPYRVPPGDFYVMGDDRANSCDSRYWGPIKGSSIIGKAVLDFWRNGHPNF